MSMIDIIDAWSEYCEQEECDDNNATDMIRSIFD